MYLDLKRSKSEEENLIIYIDLFHFSDLNTDSENEHDKFFGNGGTFRGCNTLLKCCYILN